MNELTKTYIFIAIAILLVGVAYLASPNQIRPDDFMDLGQPFFAQFNDPNEAVSLEIVSFDENSGSPVPFKVELKNGLWTIPSHHDYPADGKDCLAKTAASLIVIKKDEFRSDNVSEHALFGVVDPLDESGSLIGRGQKITVKKENDETLAEIIIGKPIKEKPGFNFVRLPGLNRVYAAKVDLDICRNFTDWIDRDLLQLTRDKIDEIIIRDYSINEKNQQVDHRDNILIRSKNGKYHFDKKGSTLDSVKIEYLIAGLTELQIVGVRPKPESFVAGLMGVESKQAINQSLLIELQRKGFYIAREGNILANEGELLIHTVDGLIYSIRFGEVLFGSGMQITAGSDETNETSQSGSENRYLFITADFDHQYFKEPALPKDTSFAGKPDSLLTTADEKNMHQRALHDTWQSKINNGMKMKQQLNQKFAAWYYVISSEAYDKIHKNRQDLKAE